MRTTPQTQAIAEELKRIIRVAGRNPELLEGALPALSSLHRVVSAGPADEPSRVHFILHRLIPEYLDRLPGGPECRAIRELLQWEDADGAYRSLATRYLRAAEHIFHSANDFGRRQEPRLLLDCARRFVMLDHEERLDAGRPQAPAPPPPAPPAEHGARGSAVAVHPNLDYHRLVDLIAGAREIAILNTWIPGIDMLADTLADALARGTSVSVLLLDPDSHIASLRSAALVGAAQHRFRQDRVRPGIRHSLDVLAAVAQSVDDIQRRNLHVRLYDSLPSISAYRIDGTAFVSFFLHGQLAVHSLQVEVPASDVVMGPVVAREIETLWSIAREIELSDPPAAASAAAG